MRLDETALTRRIQVQPRYAFGILSEHAEALLKRLEGARSMRGRVEHALMPILHTGAASMELVAQRLGMSRQTLFRKLRAEGVTFEKVLDELRCELARHFLRGRKVSVNETAYLVGFSDPAAFSRAFKRWTGMSPRDARAGRFGAGHDREPGAVDRRSGRERSESGPASVASSTDMRRRQPSSSCPRAVEASASNRLTTGTCSAGGAEAKSPLRAVNRW